MTEQEIEAIINEFLEGFNLMCAESDRAMIIRERTYNYESGPSTTTQRYDVTYMVKKRGKSWKIFAQSKGFWIFKKRFPLVQVKRIQERYTLEGLYVKGMAPFEPTELKQKLEDYTETCKNLPRDVFINS